MYASLCLVPLVFLRETYGPVLLQRRAERLRKLDPAADVWAPHELERQQQDFSRLALVVLTRPLRMISSELIVSSTCAYLALVYAIFYMTFQAFPIVFQGLYGLSPGVCGLLFLTIGGGCLLALPIFFWYDGFTRRARQRDAPWIRKEEYRRVPLACVGGPLFVVSLLWLGWSARADVPFVVPMLAGIPFGMGFMREFPLSPPCASPAQLTNTALTCVYILVIFMALINYLTGAIPPAFHSAPTLTSL